MFDAHARIGRNQQAAIDAIQTETGVSTSLEQLYRSVEELCVQKHGEWLYLKLRAACELHAVQALELLRAASGEESAETKLGSLARLWDRYCAQLHLVRHIFLYLDRTYLLQHAPHRSVFDMGLSFFRQHLDQSYHSVQSTVVQGVLRSIDAERRGDAVDRGLLKNLVRMLALLGLYEVVFMPLFLERSRAFYVEESQREVVEVDLGAYLVYVERRLREEGGRCDAILEGMTRVLLLKTVETCVIEPHVGYMLGGGGEGPRETGGCVRLCQDVGWGCARGFEANV